MMTLNPNQPTSNVTIEDPIWILYRFTLHDAETQHVVEEILSSNK